ncbi:acyl-CoA-binding domain-containing protein 6-like isoform X1 [Stegostoma tigrinum]|uniref:acyl-CoA-binding domain-containing protein 6-like isoform X1 n=1 Tax=Stegostoma tigrinum TaxID=3053191 RepID=UPI00202AEFBB|nr:acyl-CoA-binding domain-containing protein 6-like isoform X1 [Stegostoma tigrinum]
MAAVSDQASDSEDRVPETEGGGGGGGGGRALETEFERAAAHVQTLAHAAGRETLLYLYSRFKQAKFGKCNIPKPGFFDFEGKQKWEAWKAVGDMTARQAMKEYIAAVNKLDPEWNPQDSVKESDQKLRFGGPVVSSLYQEEMIRDEDKTIFDHCRENNIDHILKALVSKSVDVNLKDEEGRALLHWACDRGHKDLVGMLLQQKAEINSQDSEGQTALHYASACEFADIVELLLNSGADPTIQDAEGCLPEEVTDSKDISQMLRQYAASKG